MNFIKYLMPALSIAAVSPFLYGQDAASLPPENVGGPQAPIIRNAKKAEDVPAAEVAKEQLAVPVPPKPKKKELTEDEKTQLEIRYLKAQKGLIDAEIALKKARLTEELAPQTRARRVLEAENGLRAARNALKLAEIDAAKRKLDAQLALDKARDRLALLERENKLHAAELDVKITRMEQELELSRYTHQISQVKMAEDRSEYASSDVQGVYRKDPLENGKLYISDRRIEFNGPVTPELANHVTERIYFYNNQTSEYPIFIVIDSSPGGSVAAGYQIIKAMESSKAPVYVVVKSYAASMAAMITTAAERSFCYKNTTLLQHQPSSGVQGNLTQMKEGLTQLTHWTRNINDKLAAKMGMTYEEYVAEMYKHNSQGDWTEFGDGALKWKWVTDLVETIDETSFVRKAKPQPKPMALPIIIREHKIDERGKPYYELPTLPAGDAWMIYDPNNLYRAAK